MQFSIREARQKLSHLLNAVEQGEEIEITRRGKVVARLTKPETDESRAQERSAVRQRLRDELPPSRTGSARLIRELRDERG